MRLSSPFEPEPTRAAIKERELMEDIIALFIPIIAVGMIPFIVWINLHYKYKNRALGTMTEDQVVELDQMSKIADILDQRVNVLERILDDEVPNWRERNDKTI